jgi:hypothetical protein
MSGGVRQWYALPHSMQSGSDTLANEHSSFAWKAIVGRSFSEIE